jgi:hypothetical protein
MKKILSQAPLNVFTDANLLELAQILRKNLKNADTPITGVAKKALYELMDHNTKPFETELERFPSVLTLCRELRGLFDTDITYKQFMDATLKLVDMAEEELRKEDPVKSVKASQFRGNKSHYNRLVAICTPFPKICQIPLFREGGIFSYDLLWKPIVDATIKDHELTNIVWPFAIMPGWGQADNCIVGPSSVGRHDRVHLSLLIESIRIFPKRKEYFEHLKPGTLFMFPPEIILQRIKAYLALPRTASESKLLSEVLFKSLHEQFITFVSAINGNQAQQIFSKVEQDLIRYITSTNDHQKNLCPPKRFCDIL